MALVKDYDASGFLRVGVLVYLTKAPRQRTIRKKPLPQLVMVTAGHGAYAFETRH